MESGALGLALAIGTAVLLLAVVLAVGLTRRGRNRQAPPAVGAGPRSGGAGEGAAQVQAPKRGSGLPGVDSTASLDEVDLAAEAEGLMGVLEVEVPEPAAGRMHRLRARLARSNSAVGRGLLSLLSRDVLDAGTWDEIEETLLAADLGVGPTEELISRLRTEVSVAGGQVDVHRVLRRALLDLVDPGMAREVITVADGRPAVVLVVGVNGTGKTTTTGKLARLLVAEGRSVVLGAADTFRAAAADQLQTWGDRVGAAVVRGPEGGDPAAVAFDAVDIAIRSEVDTVVIDTAGRLHTKAGLMDELGKVRRVVEKRSPMDEVLLVIDATTGQNGLAQARVFSDAVDVTGIVLTKLDGTAKGGIVVAVQRELGVPVKLVGLGEGPDDLAPFIAEEFVDALLQP
jgi:fused signal recognition particle receptor